MEQTVHQVDGVQGSCAMCLAETKMRTHNISSSVHIQQKSMEKMLNWEFGMNRIPWNCHSILGTIQKIEANLGKRTASWVLYLMVLKNDAWHIWKERCD